LRVGSAPRPATAHADRCTDTPQYASQGVRERSSQLASYALDAEEYQDRPHRHSFADTEAVSGRHAGLLADYNGGRSSPDSAWTDIIEENSEPETPETVIGPEHGFFNPSRRDDGAPWHGSRRGSHSSRVPDVVVQDTERTPLLPTTRLSRADSQPKTKHAESQDSPHAGAPRLPSRMRERFTAGREHIAQLGRKWTNPKSYTRETVIAGATISIQTTSAVFLGLLLNILDALSYGYILFPLGADVFSETGPDGISIFFVSCIVSQLCYSLGLSKFKGGVGSEMIEVVPFFHKMAYSIMERMEGESSESIIATTIVAYCMSSVITGLIFLALGYFKLGSLVNFFPRHILIGCIGGVGFFLFVTGIEVSARLEGSLNYDLGTLQKLFSADTWYLWCLPLFLAIAIMVFQRTIKTTFVLPVSFILIFALFYIFVEGIFRMDLEVVRNAGWIFEKPEAGVKFYRFYSYFSEKLIHLHRIHKANAELRIRQYQLRCLGKYYPNHVCSFVLRDHSRSYQCPSSWCRCQRGQS
jgi:SulP family sulfate permease